MSTFTSNEKLEIFIFLSFSRFVLYLFSFLFSFWSDFVLVFVRLRIRIVDVF